MKFGRENSLVFGLFLLLVACSSSSKKEFEKTYYQKNEQQWLSAMGAMGYKNDHLRNHILLLMHTTECPPCLQELQWWNRRGNQIQASVSLVLTEQYRTAFHAFIKSQHIEFPAYQDSAAILFDQKLIPTEPIKIYFNPQGKVSLIYPVGQNGKIRAFLERIKRHKK